MTQYLLPNQLPVIDDLFRERNQQFVTVLKNLKLKDVETDEALAKTSERIKQDILLSPVHIGEPRIIDNFQETRPIPAHIGLGSTLREVEVVVVNFPFKGSSEIFGYIAAGVTYVDRGVAQPENNELNVEVELGRLDKEEALSQARKTMENTLSIINQNNPHVLAWHDGFIIRLGMELKRRQKELLDLYS